MTDLSADPSLLAAIRAGDTTAFERLVRSWYPRLADHAHRVLDDRDRAEDAVQEVLVALWRNRATLPDAASLPAYLLRGVRNRALNQLRGAARFSSSDPETIPEIETAPIAVDALTEAELGEALQRALATLAPRTREVFMLSRETGLTYPQIADTLAISVKTVETLMGRALTALRGQLMPRLRE